MLPRSRSFVIATIVLLLSLSIMTLGSSTSQWPVVPAQAQGQPTPTPHIFKDSRISIRGYESLGPELERTLSEFGVTNTRAGEFFDLASANYSVNTDTNTLNSITVGLCNSGSPNIKQLYLNLPGNSSPTPNILVTIS